MWQTVKKARGTESEREREGRERKRKKCNELAQSVYKSVNYF